MASFYTSFENESETWKIQTCIVSLHLVNSKCILDFVVFIITGSCLIRQLYLRRRLSIEIGRCGQKGWGRGSGGERPCQPGQVKVIIIQLHKTGVYFCQRMKAQLFSFPSKMSFFMFFSHYLNILEWTFQDHLEGHTLENVMLDAWFVAERKQ